MQCHNIILEKEREEPLFESLHRIFDITHMHTSIGIKMPIGIMFELKRAICVLYLL